VEETPGQRDVGELAATWLRDHGDLLYAYAMQRVGKAEVAEDLVQETLVAAIESWPRFKGGSAVRTWLVGILRHKVLDELRRRRRGPAWLEEVEREASGSNRAFAGGIWVERQVAWPDIRPGPEAEEARAIVRSCLASMPEAMRLAFTLREIDGLSSTMVCEVLDVTPTNLWTLVHRAKLRLRAELGRRWSRERE